MTTFPALAALSAIVLVGQAHAGTQDFEEFRQTCEKRLSSGSAKVVAMPSWVNYHHDRTIAELTADTSSEKYRVNQGKSTLGYTKSTYVYKTQLHTNKLVSEQGDLACGRAYVQMEIDTGPQNVWVASEYPKGSCAYRAILEHELLHALANHNAAKESAPEIQLALVSRYEDRIFYGHPSTLVEEMMADFNQAWEPWSDRLFDRAKGQHQRIDSYEQRDLVLSACGGEVMRLAESRS